MAWTDTKTDGDSLPATEWNTHVGTGGTKSHKTLEDDLITHEAANVSASIHPNANTHFTADVSASVHSNAKIAVDWGIYTDFTKYTETDPGSKITVTASKIDIVAETNGASKVIIPIRPLGNFKLDFEAYITDEGLPSSIKLFCMVGDADLMPYGTAYNGVGAGIGDSGFYPIKFVAGASTLGTAIAYSLNTLYYCRITRYGTTLTISIFSDSARTTHITGSPQTLTVVNTVFNYFHAFANHTLYATAASMYMQNLVVKELV